MIMSKVYAYITDDLTSIRDCKNIHLFKPSGETILSYGTELSFDEMVDEIIDLLFTYGYDTKPYKLVLIKGNAYRPINVTQ